MIRVRENKKWYRCVACGNLSAHPMECCGQMMDEEEDEGLKLPPYFHVLKENFSRKIKFTN